MIDQAEGTLVRPRVKACAPSTSPSTTDGKSTRRLQKQNMSHNFEMHDSSGEATPTSPGSNSASVPLLSDAEEITIDDGDKPSTSEEKKPLPSADYKIALSNFLVRSSYSASLSVLTGISQRIFSYSTKNDRLVLLFAASASISTGITLPLMNVVFGKCSRLSTSSLYI